MGRLSLMIFDDLRLSLHIYAYLTILHEHKWTSMIAHVCSKQPPEGASALASSAPCGSPCTCQNAQLLQEKILQGVKSFGMVVGQTWAESLAMMTNVNSMLFFSAIEPFISFHDVFTSHKLRSNTFTKSAVRLPSYKDAFGPTCFADMTVNAPPQGKTETTKELPLHQVSHNQILQE